MVPEAKKGFPIMKTSIWYCVPTHGVCRSCSPSSALPSLAGIRVLTNGTRLESPQTSKAARLPAELQQGVREGLKCHYKHKGLLQRGVFGYRRDGYNRLLMAIPRKRNALRLDSITGVPSCLEKEIWCMFKCKI